MEVNLCHPLEHMAGLFFVGFWVWRGDEKVIHVDDESSFSNHVLEGIIHEPLECVRGVAETKEHNCRFEESLVSDESHFPLVTILDTNVVIPPSNIKLGEVASIFQLVY